MSFFHQLGLLPELPRSYEPRAPQQLLLYLLTEYTAGPTSRIPASGLLEILASFEITTAAGRAAMSRLARRGLIVPTKSGRYTSYAISPDIYDGILAQERDVMMFGHTDREWDETWTIVLFQLNEGGKSQSHVIRNQLRWLGFAPVRDGVWISPHADITRTKVAVSELMGDQAHIYQATQVMGELDLEKVWALDEIEADYQAFAATCRSVRYQIRIGELSDRKAFVQRSELAAIWRRFPTLDPDLPARLLPVDWPRRATREVFGDVMESLADGANRYFRSAMAAHGAALEECSPG